ncbi:putative helicase [Salmonella phage PVPSE1]|uniref:DNA helicase Pif1-like DEAD-box helicase domain-containing protein n=3 Tax=Seunavirus TaxID=1914851 RepID=K4I5J7_9CAUD|nr:helicase [Salmonella phage PVPSE1]YP_009148880.1 helicase [Salmonella phage SSE121]ADP02399.1 putative helicase [Salmonella phage PVPSE1]AFU63725.1 hypothetical protein [Salmonella phage SSE121]
MSDFGVGVEAALGAVMSGDNVFVTGPGGSGKSYTIKTIQSLYAGSVLTVAPTGAAAINVNGMTAHRAFGLTMGVATKKDTEEIKPKVKRLLKSKALKIIIIDEISMFRADKLWEMDMKCRLARKQPNKPFGGLQICMFGDFFQNPPVLTETEKETYFQFHYTELACFSDTWKELNPYPILLEKVYRQSSVHFSTMLNCLRRGQRIPEIVKFMNTHCYDHGKPLDAITITSTNAAADKVNKKRFDEVPGLPTLYTAKKSGEFTQKPVPEELYLKEGAQVMITVNDPKGFDEPEYVNGSRGEIIELGKDSVKVRLDCGKVVDVDAYVWENVEYNPIKVRNSDGTTTEEIEKITIGEYRALPIRLGWAVTIHKAQGLTLPELNIDFGYGAFAPGMAYVAFSRATSAKGLRLLKKVKEKDIIVDQRIVRFYEETFPGK